MVPPPDAAYQFDRANATIIHWHQCNPSLAVFRVAPDEGPAPAFTPGQFATLALPHDHPPIHDPGLHPPGDPKWKKLYRRAYSIASSAHERRWLEFYVVVVHDGKLTSKLWSIKENGRVYLDPQIKGEFTLDPVGPDRMLVLVGTGTGIAPYMSMLRTYRATGRWRRFVLIEGCRDANDLGFRQELDRFAAEDASVVYVPTLTREPMDSGWTGERGRVQRILEPDRFEQLAGEPLSPDTCEVFLCGNPNMIDECETLLNARGFTTRSRKQAGNLHFERYW